MMRRADALLMIAFMVVCLLSGVSTAQQQRQLRHPENKVLIVYLSRTNNTKAIAEMIQRRTGGRPSRA